MGTRTIFYREFARNIKFHLESLLLGEIVEVRGPHKGVICYLTKDIETITSGQRDGVQQGDNTWL